MRKKRLRGILLGGAVVLIAMFVWLFVGRGKGDVRQKPEVAAAVRGPITKTVSATGRVVPDLVVEIKCEASGEVVSVLHDVSDHVEKGDLLVELDPTGEQRNVTRAEIALAASRARVEQKRNALTVAERTLATDRQRAAAALASAEAGAKDARAKAVRLEQLLRKGLASQEDYDTANAAAVKAESELKSARIRMEELSTQELSLEVTRRDLELAETQVRSDEVGLADARERLSDTKVQAPMEGVIASRYVEVGQIVSSGTMNIGGGTTLLTVADLRKIFVLAAVDESDIGQVKVGQRVSITVDAFPDETFTGRVERIATTGVNVSDVVTFEVKIEVTDDKRTLLKPEMTADVDIVIAHRDNALLVPARAVRRSKGGYTILVEDSGGPPAKRPVRIGIANDVTIEIVQGLGEGERVLLASEKKESKWRRGGFRGPRPPMH